MGRQAPEGQVKAKPVQLLGNRPRADAEVKAGEDDAVFTGEQFLQGLCHGYSPMPFPNPAAKTRRL
jgi:hypothetical protein